VAGENCTVRGFVTLRLHVILLGLLYEGDEMGEGGAECTGEMKAVQKFDWKA
jgi:hypothetical protein